MILCLRNWSPSTGARIVNADLKPEEDALEHDLESHLEKTAQDLLDANARETEHLCWTLGLTRDDVLRAYVLYDLGVDQTGNEVFDSVALRYAMHLHNRLQQSWHLARQRIIAERTESIRSNRIVEVGFGTPQKYVWECIWRGTQGAEDVSVHLLDFGYSSMAFGQSLLWSWGVPSWSKVVRFRSFDMECGGYVGDYDCYIFQDSIEHVSDPTAYLWETVSRAPCGAHFLFSLPIEVVKVMPQHFISWCDAGEVQSWLERSGLTVLFKQEIFIDRSVDVFAQKLHPDYRQIIFHCQKPLV